jgi:hypothetical protein
LKQFQKDQNLEETGVLDQSTYNSLLSAVVYDWNTSKTHDLQYAQAIEVLNNG